MASTATEITVAVVGPDVVEPNGEEAVVTDIDGDRPVADMRRRLRPQQIADATRTASYMRRTGYMRRPQNAGATRSAGYLVSRRRVPQSLIDIKLISPKAIAPEMVSIGPFHHGGELLEFESCKLWFLNRLLSRTKRHDGTDLLGDLFKAVESFELAARVFYDEDVHMSSPDFIEMMVLDGCFIIELFLLPDRVGDDPISTQPWLYPIITRDLLKLENQLPFMVLVKLFDVIATAADVEDPLGLLALKFFSLSLPRHNDAVFKSPDSEYLLRSDEYSHLLELFHWSFCSFLRYKENQLRLIPAVLPRFLRPPLPEQSEHDRVSLLRLWSVSIPIFCLRWGVSTIFYCLGWSIAILRFLYNVLFYCLGWSVSIITRFLSPILPNSEEHRHPVLSIHSATQLRPSGVKFKPHKTDNLLEINFTNRVLQIPPITINDLTITVFINCLAYEHVYDSDGCVYHCARDSFTQYIAFLSCLINSPRDVAFFCAEGIIASYSHNDHYIAGLFSKLGEKVYFHRNTRGYLDGEFRAVEAYYNSHWGTFMRTYFSTPWSFISVVSAVILLVLTGGQTVLAVLGYIHQRGNQL